MGVVRGCVEVGELSGGGRGEKRWSKRVRG